MFIPVPALLIIPVVSFYVYFSLDHISIVLAGFSLVFGGFKALVIYLVLVVSLMNSPGSLYIIASSWSPV